MPPVSVRTLLTPGGAGRAHLHVPDGPRSPRGTLLLGHGAGGGVDAADLQALTSLAANGWVVVLLEQPWRVAGRRIAVAPPKLDEAATAMLVALRVDRPSLPRPWVLGGRSAGARVAARLSDHAQALCLISFPLQPPAPHPPVTKTGRVRATPPSRAHELVTPLRAGIPTLVLQGTNDRFGGPEDIRQVVTPFDGALTLRSYPGDHNRNNDVGAAVADVADFLAALP